MDLSLSEEQRAFRDLVRAFAEEVVAPQAAAFDEREEFPLETIRRMG
ncbi:MAG TPA: acyl-CoA dehydrogenase family protein, partial [Actinomycetota bacterium]|nr:acyl-CoA dehydrogenase family protein [Actinomycetota bacterium]